MLITILIVLLILSLIGSFFIRSGIGYWSLTPTGIILLVLFILWLTGNIHC